MNKYYILLSLSRTLVCTFKKNDFLKNHPPPALKTHRVVVDPSKSQVPMLLHTWCDDSVVMWFLGNSDDGNGV